MAADTASTSTNTDFLNLKVKAQVPVLRHLGW